MAFGVSGNDKKSQMIGGDVTVAWMEHSTGKYWQWVLENDVILIGC